MQPILHKSLRLLFYGVFLLNVACTPDSETELPKSCKVDCKTPFGTILGTNSGVPAFSNCQTTCINPESHQTEGSYTGLKWQCVEYARRWLLLNRNAVYGDVDIAADIWNQINHLVDIDTKKKHPLVSHVNGSIQPPKIGDLLIYAKAFLGTGHVAVVTNVDDALGLIQVAEQNFTNDAWSGDHARKIEIVKRGDAYWVLEPYILGWKHLQHHDESIKAVVN